MKLIVTLKLIKENTSLLNQLRRLSFLSSRPVLLVPVNWVQAFSQLDFNNLKFDFYNNA